LVIINIRESRKTLPHYNILHGEIGCMSVKWRAAYKCIDA
jgi:hypothetical protein